MSEEGVRREEAGKHFISVAPVYEPYAYVAISVDPETKRLYYLTIEPLLLEEERKDLEKIKEILLEELDVDLNALEGRHKAEEYLKKALKKVVKKYKLRISDEALGKITYYVIRDFVGFGKIDPMMRDHMVEDISCDGVGVPIYVWHREYESLPSNVIFNSADELDSFVARLAYRTGKHVSIAQPIVDAALPDGSRINITFSSEVSRKGSSFTIRKFRADPLTVTDLIIFNTITSEMAAYFWLAMENKMSIVVAGGTATGKTTLLNCLAMFIRPEHKIVTVEDTAELNLPHENWLPMVTRSGWGTQISEVTLFDLLKAAMRQRPDYIIVGEVRGEEAYTLFHAIATGHGGLCSIHADSVPAVIHRLESEPMNVPRQLLTLLNAIVVLSRTRVGKKPARRVSVSSEVVALDPRTKEVLTNDVYKWDPRNDQFTFTGRSYLLDRIAKEFGFTPEYIKEELARRKTVLDWMVKKNIRTYRDVGNVIREYYLNPIRTYRRAKMELVG
ncbi:MAG: type IV secretory pathway protein [Thermoprotei archaeon]|nr:MAG: type IV secretory pathway protein [Thermoprotei archaeon]RLF17889.1 MAG: type IV secretory pathway protein [Thermoprotei archaeon]